MLCLPGKVRAKLLYQSDESEPAGEDAYTSRHEVKNSAHAINDSRVEAAHVFAKAADMC